MPAIVANGTELSVDERGDGQAVLFVCGTGQPAAMWDMVGRPEVEAAGFRTITFDNRGIPPSAVPEPPYRMQDLVDDTIAVIEHFNAGRCHLVGASLGANIVSSVARQRPDLVASMVMRVGGGNYRTGLVEKFTRLLDLYQQGGDAARQAQRGVILDALLTTAQRHDSDAQAAVEPLVETLANSSDDWSGTIGQTTANLEWAERDHLDDAAEISVPSLMIANELDAYFSPEDLSAAADQMADCAFVLHPGLPHASLDPDVARENNRRMIEFIGSHRQH